MKTTTEQQVNQQSEQQTQQHQQQHQNQHQQQQQHQNQQQHQQINNDDDAETNEMDSFDASLLAPGWEPPGAVHRLRSFDHTISSADPFGPRSIDERTTYGGGLNSIRDKLDFNRTIIITHLDRGTNGLLTIRLTTTYYRY